MAHSSPAFGLEWGSSETETQPFSIKFDMDENIQIQPETPLVPKIETAVGRTVLRFIFGSFLEIVGGKVQYRSNKEEREAMRNLCKLGELYFSEMVKCLEVNATLAATAMACSGFETLLMLACICYRDMVKSTKTWRVLCKKAKNHSFVHVLKSRLLTIEKLIEIGEELKWFSNDIPQELVAHVTPQELADFLALVPPGTTATAIAPRYARDYRNRLHPAVCLRNNLKAEDSRELLMGTTFMAVALSCFAERHGAEF